MSGCRRPAHSCDRPYQELSSDSSSTDRASGPRLPVSTACSSWSVAPVAFATAIPSVTASSAPRLASVGTRRCRRGYVSARSLSGLTAITGTDAGTIPDQEEYPEVVNYPDSSSGCGPPPVCASRASLHPPASITSKSLRQFSSSSLSGSWSRNCCRSDGGTTVLTRSMMTWA